MRQLFPCFIMGVVVLYGCSRRGYEHVKKFDGVTVTVRLAQPPRTEYGGGSSDGVHTWKATDVYYVVDHMKLSVNEQNYGLLKAGDSVLIEAGRVTVNDVERKTE